MWGRSQSFGAWVPSLAEGLAFLKIEDVMGVYRTITETARERRAA